MIDAANNLAARLNGAGGVGGVGQANGPVKANGTGFADTFKDYLSEVTQLQQDASQAVEGMVTGQSDDLAGVMAAMEKSDLAFKTLMAIRTKLLDAYEELRNMPI